MREIFVAANRVREPDINQFISRSTFVDYAVVE